MKPWWNEECQEAKKRMNEAEEKPRANPGSKTLMNEVEVTKNAFKETVEKGKRNSWRIFAATFNARVSTFKVWNTLRAIDGRGKHPSPEHLYTGTEETSSLTKRKQPSL